MVGRVALGDQSGLLELVEGALLEADRERADPVRAFARRERGERRGVDPSREQHADRHVGDEMGPDRIPQALTQLGGEHVRVLAPDPFRGNRARASVPAEADVGAVGDQQVAGRELARLAEDRERRRDRVERQESLERVQVDFLGEARHGEQRLQLGREREGAARDPVVERLDPEAVARQHEAAGPRVPDRDREAPRRTRAHGPRRGGRGPPCRSGS